jgi:hypothetical protein
MAQDQPAGWVYSQSTDEMTLDGQHVVTGYSGAGPGRNNPAMQASQGQGPIPQGSYSVGTAHQGADVRVAEPDLAGRAMRGAIFLALCVLAAGPVRAAAMPGAAGITAAIGRDGARAEVTALNRGGQWDHVLRKIDGGQEAWLDVAARLAPGTDAGAAEDLGISLATALPRNPAGVLRVVSDDPANAVIGVKRVCGVPFIEQPAPETARYVARASAALRRVADPALAARKARCLAALRG